MLLPALNQARAKAHAISCVNNLKQCGTAQRMYADDFDGKMPMQARFGNGIYSWGWVMLGWNYADDTGKKNDLTALGGVNYLGGSEKNNRLPDREHLALHQNQELRHGSPDLGLLSG